MSNTFAAILASDLAHWQCGGLYAFGIPVNQPPPWNQLCASTPVWLFYWELDTPSFTVQRMDSAGKRVEQCYQHGGVLSLMPKLVKSYVPYVIHYNTTMYTHKALCGEIRELLQHSLQEKWQLSADEADQLKEMVDQLDSDDEFVICSELDTAHVGRGDSDHSKLDSEDEKVKVKKISKTRMHKLTVKAKKCKGDFGMLIIGDVVQDISGDVVMEVSLQCSPACSITKLPSEAKWCAAAADIKANGHGLPSLLAQLQELASEVAHLPNLPPTTTHIHETGIMFIHQRRKNQLDYASLSQFTTVVILAGKALRLSAWSCEEQNNDGHCFTLALEWMAEIVVKGLQIEWHENSGVKEVEGLCLIDTIEMNGKKVNK
ncbi:hypothetical protein C8J57DRAFT_1249692 [Mycena rebaudengoi]|nr:hypothetical protein C8J57DRAFT_1249692 [Mycena rebaudengoi]